MDRLTTDRQLPAGLVFEKVAGLADSLGRAGCDYAAFLIVKYI
jgi:hypothetical protein